LHNCGNGIICHDVICKNIYRVSSILYLGLTIDKNLRWNLHVNNIVSRLRTVTYRSYKLRAFLPIKTLRTIYFALYQAILQYGLLVWGGLAKNAIQPLLIQQRQIIRVCLSKQNLVGSTSTNFKLLNVSPFESLYKKIAIMFMIKNFNLWV